jgi:pyridoxal phosphate enzyme (YggS family)
MSIRESYQHILSNLRKVCEDFKRNPDSVRLIAVSKTKPLTDVLEAYDAGCRDFGENYVQEILEKAPQAPSDIRWHFIGHLQSNKAKKVAPYLTMLHTLDSAKLAKMIHEVKKAELLLQVNIGREEQKSGLLPEQVVPLVKELSAEKIFVGGLMCIPPASEDPEASRPFFKALRELRDKVQQETGLSLPELSMGMTADAAIAIQEGATMVRVGTAIFGYRKYTA